MLKLLGKWLNIYEDEISLFLWCTILLFLIHSSNILFNNFAETAFLKRYGVEYLPIVYMINSISTFFIMGFMTPIMARLPGSRLLMYILVFCGGSVAGLRFVVPLGIDLLYPFLFILKSQYEVLLGLVFWNLANDLFNTRQSKRLFPLITAGGVLGGVIGSLGTPFLAKTITLDNLMFAYLGTTMIGALAVQRMGTRFPTLLISDRKAKKTKARPSVAEEFKKVWPMIRDSGLVRILIFLTLLPNVVIPIMNYQFNFAIDQTFATEGGMIRFFGYFRGVLNVISLIILLFVGRIYGRWGLPVALIFHPVNYVIAFVSFLLRFDIFSAMYARISTNVLRTTINNPARAVLVGLVPATYRAVVRPFLRGTVVRLGILIGSGLIMISENLVHPRYLSVIACLFVGGWIATTFFLKKTYSKILLDLISNDMLDLKTMEEHDVSQVFTDKNVKSQLLQAFLSAHGNDCLWYARLLKSLGMEDLDTHILAVLKGQDDRTRIKLLSLLSPEAGRAAIQVFREISDPEKPELMKAIVKAAKRLPAQISSDLILNVFKTVQHPEVKAYALAGLYRQSPQKCKRIIDVWLKSSVTQERKAGIIAAGESQDSPYVSRLKEMLNEEGDSSILPFIFQGLHNLGAEDINASLLPYLIHPLEQVRSSALQAIDIHDEETLRRVIALMGDPSEEIHVLAKEKIHTASYNNAQVLVESLAIPRRKVREGIFELLEFLNIKDLDLFRFARSQIERGYMYMVEVEALLRLTEGRERNLLMDHLDQKRLVQTENVLRVLAMEDRSGKMKTIWRGLSSADDRQRSNSMEALDDLMDPSLAKILIPLLEDRPASERLAIGRKNFQLPKFDSNTHDLFAHLLSKKDWVTVLLTLHLAIREGTKGIDRRIVEPLLDSENDYIRWMAQCSIILENEDTAGREALMATEISIPDKIIHLKGIHIFEGLSVSELAAVASVTEEVVYPSGELVIKEGEPGETMYLITKGEVSVIKGQGTEREIELDRIGVGDYFGEMALFEGDVRSATIRTSEQSNLLVLHKREFTEIVREYPQIALRICKVLSQRLRELHQKIQG
jgi:ATP/ADP translocase